MFKRLMLLGLFTMSMVTILVTEAKAGCIPLSGGGQYCADWITGSKICNGKATGIEKVCDQAGNCNAEVLCAAGGTLPTTASPNPDNCNDKNSYFPKDADKCGISGIAFCVTKPGDVTEAQGQPFTFDSTLSGISKPFSCTKDGSCMFRKELIPSDFSSVKCINPNWTGVNFAASKFKAKSCYCPGSYNTDMVPPKCEPSPTDGVESCLIELCTLNLEVTRIKIAETHNYSCSLLPTKP